MFSVQKKGLLNEVFDTSKNLCKKNKIYFPQSDPQLTFGDEADSLCPNNHLQAPAIFPLGLNRSDGAEPE